MAIFIPKVGVKGLYNLSAPFAALLIPNVPYTCGAIRSLQDIINAGEDPIAEYYTPVNLTTDEYQSDLAAGACIITLQTDAGDVLYVPSTYFNSFPDIGGVPYQVLVLAINIGAVPDSLDLTNIKAKISSDILEMLGVSSVVTTVAVSKPTLLSVQDAATVEAARQAQIQTVTTDYALYLKAMAERDTALQQVVELQNFILTTNGLSTIPVSPITTDGEEIILTPGQMSVITPAQIAALQPANIAGLTNDQLSALSVAQVSALTVPQISALSQAQAKLFTPAQIAGFTPAQSAAFNAVLLPQV